MGPFVPNQGFGKALNFKRRLKAHFELYLKECEWSLNNSEIKSQISILKQLVK